MWLRKGKDLFWQNKKAVGCLHRWDQQFGQIFKLCIRRKIIYQKKTCALFVRLTLFTIILIQKNLLFFSFKSNTFLDNS